MLYISHCKYKTYGSCCIMLCLKNLRNSTFHHRTQGFARLTGVLEFILLFQAAQDEPSRFPEVELCVEISGKLPVAIILLSWAGEERITIIQQHVFHSAFFSPKEQNTKTFSTKHIITIHHNRTKESLHWEICIHLDSSELCPSHLCKRKEYLSFTKQSRYSIFTSCVTAVPS